MLKLSKILSIICSIILLVSCSQPKPRTWNIALHSTDALLEIKLPSIPFDSIKHAVDLSDCTTCRKYHTILSDKAIISTIGDTIGYFRPWESNSQAILYITEALNPHSISSLPIDLNEEMNKLISQEKQNDPWVNIIDTHISDHFAILRYAYSEKMGIDQIENIRCVAYIDEIIFNISYEQYDKLPYDLGAMVFDGMKKMKLKK